MTLSNRLGAAALLVRAAPAKGKLPAAHVAALRGCADLRRSASTLVPRAPATAGVLRPTAQGPTSALAASAAAGLSRGGGGGGGGWEGRSEGNGDANAMWRLALASGAGLVLVVGQEGCSSQCQEGADVPSEGELKIAQMSENKANGQQGAWMAKIEAYGAMVVPYVNMALEAIDYITPYIVKAFQVGKAIYEYLPVTIIEALGGLAMCFFGGLYPLTIAAVETFRVSGGEDALKHLGQIWEEMITVYEANKADNATDADGDGVADVKQITNKEVVTRKMALILKTINPSKLLEAYGGLAKAFAGVLATLKLQFAKVIALAASIADAIRPVMIQFVAPLLVAVIPADYHKWVHPLIDVFCKFAAGSVAWFMYRVVAAVHSGIVGGLICTRALMRYANEKKYLSWKHEETMLDEYLGWSIAAVGVYFQVSNWMSVPFPLNILFLPVTMLESYLQWVVTWMD